MNLAYQDARFGYYKYRPSGLEKLPMIPRSELHPLLHTGFDLFFL